MMRQKDFMYNNWLLLLLLPLFFTGCRQDVTATTHLLGSEWHLMRVTTGGKIYKPEEDGYLREEAYVLTFNTDSTFTLRTSVNTAGGNYTNAGQGDISVHSYDEFTEVAVTDPEEKRLNEVLLKVVEAVTSYSVLGRTLVLNGSEGEAKFTEQ